MASTERYLRTIETILWKMFLDFASVVQQTYNLSDTGGLPVGKSFVVSVKRKKSSLTKFIDFLRLPVGFPFLLLLIPNRIIFT